ncbi:MAG: DEAD/DEAH box helicase family protein [Nannocystis sp.]|nr:DEAD/DEAH box helicase family protein [Nannocystis sp.]MBA3546095.1 DEAD/DEAH box helicase family protein [Nannocystis sp.]
MNFESLLARADDETLQDLLGRPAVRLLAALDPALTRASSLRDLVTGLRSSAELLRDKASRRALTDLLPPSEAAALAALLGASGSSPFEALQALPVAKGSARERQLLSYFGVAVPTDPESTSPPSPRSSPVDYGLFRHQRDAARACAMKLNQDPRRVLLHMPTGAGKTRTAMNVLAGHFRSREPTLIVWLAYSDELCEQAAEEFEEAWRFVGDRAIDVHRFWGPRSLELSGGVTDGLVVCGLSKLVAIAKRDLGFLATLADRSSLVVIDEAHQAVAPAYRTVLEVLVEKNPDSSLLGLTATPGRTWNDPARDKQLAEFFGRKKVTLAVAGYPNPVDYLVAEGYLAKPTFKSLPYDGGRLSESEAQELAEALDVPAAIVERLAADEQRNLLIIEKIEALLKQHVRVIVFGATVAHSRLIATVLRARGHAAFSVDSGTPQDERQRTVELFKEDTSTPMALCNYGVFTTGFDAPKTSAAVIARPTKSLVLYSQMVGRAIRGLKANGNAEAEIVTIVDTKLAGFGSLSDAFKNWEDVWQ